MLPPLEMVDDILTISTCGAASVALNVMVNSFMSSKKLQLNKLKCAKIHIGRNYERCPDIMVQGGLLKDSDKEKYFGDKIHKKKQHETIVERLLKANGILANILAVIDDIPLGHKRIEIGLELRRAWFINGTI